MLNATELSEIIKNDKNDRNRLTIVPMPDPSDIKKRGATSIDLRLGRWFVTFNQTRRSAISLADLRGYEKETKAKTREHFVRFGDEFTIHPGRFVLGVTFEWIRLPASLSAQLLGKSSLGRHGLIIETASGVHPNFSGCLTLEIANVGEVPLKVFPGMQIAQLFVHEVEPSGSRNRGSLSGSRKPSVPAIERDKILRSLSKNPD